MSGPVVKVIVPCYEYAEHLPGCVESVLAQEGVEVRVLVVDDCSPDETPAVAQRLRDGDRRVEYHRNEANLGLIRSVNRGLEWADDGDYVVVISADDLLAPGSLGRAAAVMESNPSVGLTYGRAVHFGPGQPPHAPGRQRGVKLRSGPDWIGIRCRMGHNCIASPEAVVRTSVQRRAGSYDLPSHHASELNMWLRIAALSDVAYVKGGAQAFYRIHAESMLRTMLADGRGAMTDLSTRRTAFESFFADGGAGMAGAERLRGEARRALARQALWQASRAYDRNRVAGAGGVSAQEWIEFALETCPDARELSEWRGLRLRQRIGPGRTLLFPPFLATGALQRMRSHYYRTRLRRRGI